MKTTRNRWTEKEIQFIKDAIMRGKKPRHIASELKYRTYGAVIKKVETIRSEIRKQKGKPTLLAYENRLELLEKSKEILQKNEQNVKTFEAQNFLFELNKITEMADIAGLELTITITKKTF